MLIEGRSGAGKSDLALRLLDRGAELVSDDYTVLRCVGDRLIAKAPTAIAGKIEVRGVGLLCQAYTVEAPVHLIVSVDEPVPRLPEEARTRTIAGIVVPIVALAALEASAPIKVERALALVGMS